MPSQSPLFRNASRDIQRAAQDAFSRTELGRIVKEVQSLARSGRAQGSRLERALLRYGETGSEGMLRDLRGMQFGQFAQELIRYSRKPSLRQLIQQFLRDLGPAGKLIQAVAGVGAGGQVDGLDYLASLLQAYGFESLPPPGKLRGGASGKRSLEAAKKYLEEAGYTVFGPGQRADRNLREGQQEGQRQQQSQAGAARQAPPPQPTEVFVPLAGGGMGRFPPNHPIVTGDMVPAGGSSNVHSFGYDHQSAYLYVRFLGAFNKQTGRKEGPGPVYRYSGVSPEEFLGLLSASSKGGWVWDQLRIRGTVSGHQKDYELVGIEGGYVPRKATVIWNPQTRQYEEWFVKRKIRGTGGRWFESEAESQYADRGRLPDYMLGLDRGAQPWRPGGTSPDSAAPDQPW